MSKTASADSPADTNMMRIVHQALRRDLARAQTALNSSQAPLPAQRTAIARHVEWMMSFLHAHHRSEDEGLYPLVRNRAPGAAELLDAMDAEHRAVASAIAEIEDAARSLSNVDDRDVERLARALAGLSRVLLPHLEHEEDVTMPVVSSVVNESEWRDLEQRYNVKGKSFTQLGYEGHWLIDDASTEDRRRVVAPRSSCSSIRPAARARQVVSSSRRCMLGHSRTTQPQRPNERTMPCDGRCRLRRGVGCRS